MPEPAGPLFSIDLGALPGNDFLKVTRGSGGDPKMKQFHHRPAFTTLVNLLDRGCSMGQDVARQGLKVFHRSLVGRFDEIRPMAVERAASASLEFLFVKTLRRSAVEYERSSE